MTDQHFEIVVDGVPYAVTASPFEFNAETRYKVQYGGNEHIFTFDPRVGRLAPIDDDSINIPDNLEEEISRRLGAGRP